MKLAVNPFPSNINDIAKEVETMSKEDKQSCIEDIENEITSLLSIYSEEAHEIEKSEYASVKLNSLPLDSVIYKILEINIYTRESDPYILVLQEDEEKSTEKPIRFIPLLRLKVFFPFSYPKLTPPVYSFISNWLSQKYLKQLQVVLNKMWTANSPVVFEWVDYIQHGFLDTLDFAKGRKIQFLNDKNYHDMIEYLIFFDNERDQQEFCNSEVTCDICMSTMAGNNFIRLLACKHYTCKDCYKSYCESLIFDGKVSQITCYFEDCKTLIPDTFLKKTLSSELYERYETFSVNKALESMEDIAWCPRCEGPAFKDDPKSIVAFCQNCEYRFCMKCQETFHPFQRCKSLVVKEEVLFHKLKGKVDISNSLNSALSNLFINKYTKLCPKCKAPIIKAGGCNKIICKKCEIFFCWLCLQQIQGYEHFGGNCVLFTDKSLTQGLDDIMDISSDPNAEEYKELTIGAPEFSTRCPECGIINFKESKLNLIKCDKCKASYCFFCGELATEDHYDVSQCLKYS